MSTERAAGQTAVSPAERDLVPKQKYRIGELVYVVDTSLACPSTMCAFRIINTYLVEKGERVYRLRQIEAPKERVAAESELRRA